jgi:hypothetical protein
MTKHTPGPWKAAQPKHDPQAWDVCTESGGVLAKLPWGGEGGANAKLMAAAPDTARSARALAQLAGELSGRWSVERLGTGTQSHHQGDRTRYVGCHKQRRQRGQVNGPVRVFPCRNCDRPFVLYRCQMIPATPAGGSSFYCEADCMSEGKCSSQCSECAQEFHDANEPHDDGDTGEDTNVEDSHAR